MRKKVLPKAPKTIRGLCERIQENFKRHTSRLELFHHIIMKSLKGVEENASQCIIIIIIMIYHSFLASSVDLTPSLKQSNNVLM